MLRYVSTLALAVVWCVTVQAQAAPPQIAESAAVVLRSDTGDWLYSKSADTPMYPASTTKILTTLLAIEAGDPERMVIVAPADTKVEPSVVGLLPGQQVPLGAMFYAAMLRSANDAAMTIARSIGGSTAGFAEKMNARARQAGATHSHFVNPHGLHDPRHYTTAHDLALITREAMSNPTFRQITATKTYTWRYTAKPELLDNHNRMLRTYVGCIGGKTGYTKAASKTLVVVAKRGNVELIAVLLKGRGEQIWKDAAALLDYGFGRSK